MATQIQGYNFDGDPDGLKFLGVLTYDEIQSVLYLVDNRGKANMQGGLNVHFEVTKSSDGTYMISKVQASASGSWF